VKGGNAMIMPGIDAHKRTHTVVAVDELGRRLAVKTTTATTTEDHLELIQWADQFGTERTWAVEDCCHLSRRLERDMLAAGERLVRVPPKMMAHSRDSARTYGKPDPIDALAVAGPRCGSRACPRPTLMSPPASCVCWSTTART
jgi:transposase